MQTSGVKKKIKKSKFKFKIKKLLDFEEVVGFWNVRRKFDVNYAGGMSENWFIVVPVIKEVQRVEKV